MSKKKQTYIGAIATLMGGSLIAQIFTVLCSPVLTRLFSPEALGVYSLVTGAVTMFGSIMSFRYELCIVSEKEEEKVYSLIKLSVLICVILSMVIFGGYCLYFSLVKNHKAFISLSIITALLVFLYGVINIATAYNNRQQQYQLITKTYVKRVFAQNACNVVAGLLKCGPIGLSFSHLIGYLAGVLGQIKPMLLVKDRIFSASKKQMVDVFRENRKQALLSTPATFANGMSYTLINYFIEALFSTAIVGYYSISYRVLGLPITIISGNISKVFLEKASKEYNQKGNFVSSFRTTMFFSILMAIPIGITLYCFAPWACEVFFGEGWEIAGIYIRILTPMFMLRFVAGGVNTSAIIVDKQQIDFGIQASFVIGLCIILGIGKYTNCSVEQFLTMISILFSIIYVIYILLFYYCAKNKNGISDETK